mgnify:CR=1 FL=1|jgi:hypothetical protein
MYGDEVEVLDYTFNKHMNTVEFRCNRIGKLDEDIIHVIYNSNQLKFLKRFIKQCAFNKNKVFSTWGEAVNSLVGRYLTLNNYRQFS